MKSVKYCLVANGHWQNIMNAEATMTGLYMWAECFDQPKEKSYAFPATIDELEYYDIIHINWTTANAELVEMFAEALKNSSTKLVVNVDYSVEQWQQMVLYPDWLRRSLRDVDLVFHVEPVGASALAAIIERDVAVLPHPANIEWLRNQRKDIDKRDGIIAYWHRYDRQWMGYWVATRGLGEKVSIVGLKDDASVPLHRFEEPTLYVQDWPSWIRMINMRKYGIDLFTQHNQGRIAIEHAALRIPIVASSMSAASHRLWPELTVNPWDWNMARGALRMLKQHYGSELIESMLDYAEEKVEYYNRVRSRNRMLEALGMS